jgi:hypothetical protein
MCSAVRGSSPRRNEKPQTLKTGLRYPLGMTGLFHDFWVLAGGCGSNIFAQGDKHD